MSWFFSAASRGEANAVSGGLVLVLALLFSANLFAQQHDPLRPSASFEQEPKTAPLVNAENNDRKRTRSYAMQPPTIPHKTDNYQVDKYANKCLDCHARTRAADTQATPISITHYMDRDGNFLAEVSPRRYFCEQCHVLQMETKPQVGNRFRDVESMVRAKPKPAAKK
jgi:nitrate reductase (cytochrome), electron transfer subunit